MAELVAALRSDWPEQGLVAVFGRNDEKNQRVLSELKAIGVPSVAVSVDVTKRAGLEPAVYLASRASDFVTGTTIRVDGGYAIRWYSERNSGQPDLELRSLETCGWIADG